MALRQLWLGCLFGGLLLQANGAVLVPTDSDWKFFKGLAEASAPDPTAWRAINFDDSAWSEAPAPFYYGEPLTGTPLDDMRNNYTCLFMRRAFVVTNVAEVVELELGAVSDDGFIAWINGTEVARYNMPEGDITYDGNALPALTEPIPFETYSLTRPGVYLVPGTNLIAVQAFNASLSGSSDFVINVSLSSPLDEGPPVVANVIPSAGAHVTELTHVEVFFSEPVAGVDAADLLINTSPATKVTEFAPGQFLFEFPQPSDGLVQMAWSANHEIRDLAIIPHPFAGGNWTYTIDPQAEPSGLLISEFMADNDKGIHDEDGDSSDWIEIYNGGATAANLDGWFLTDTTNNLTKWRFPETGLEPSSYLLVFATEKNRTNPAARLHTNFKLDDQGEYLALVDAATNVVSEFAPRYPSQLKDVSYGRERSNPQLLSYFLVPTPGITNVSGGPGFSPEVEFSDSSRTFVGSFALVLSANSPDAVIHYVRGTNMPTELSPIYTEPLLLTNTVQVRARAFVPGLLPGPPRSEHFIALNPNVVNFSSDLPLVILHDNGGGVVSAASDKFVMMQIFDRKNGRSSLTNAPDLSVRAKFKLRGSSTEGYPKGSFALETWNEFNDDKAVSVLGMPADSDWIFYAPNNFEPVLIHNPFIYQLSREIGRYATRTRFAEVYLNTRGGLVAQTNYNGIYVIEERIKRGQDRVDIDNLEPEHSKPPEVTGGYMFKIDRADPGDAGFSGGGQQILYVDPKEREMKLPQRAAQRTYIRDYFNAFNTRLNTAGFTNPITGYLPYVDAGSWIDNSILNVLAWNVDALRLSTYFYKPRSGKITYGPIWDFDRALGSTDGRDVNPRVWGDTFFTYPWWGKMFRDPNFWQLWIDRWQELRRDQFTTNHINALIDSLVNEVRLAQPREQAKWRITPRGGSYQGEINMMKTWLGRRVHFIDTNLLAAPVLSSAGGRIQPGFSVAMTGPAGTIYYTLDGTDPRLSGGAIASGALAYTAPFVLSSNARVVARAHNPAHKNLTGGNNPPISSPWSGPVAATFVVQTPALAITEIMFHPAPPPGGNTNDADNFEFIELKNIGTTTLDLTGVRFTNGIEFTFTSSSILSLGPKARVVVVKNRAAFSARYPAVTNVAGEFAGTLNNGGNRLYLEGALKEPILDFRYDDKWYPVTDGLGFSLVIVDERAAPELWSDQANWGVSSTVNGSPGRPDPSPPLLPAVVINEARTRSESPILDVIELHNPTASEADVGGWFLTDDFRTPKKYRIPEGTKIPGSGFLVFTEAHFNAGPGEPFSLSAKGDEVYLFSGDAAGDLTGYFHGFKFGAAGDGVSFGRFLTVSRQEHFVAQLTPTLNAPNSGPKVGPVVIDEIMFNPPPLGTNNNTLDEFIELRNFSQQAVPLFDLNIVTNTWRLGGGAEFDFPTNLVLPANGYLLVVNFDPDSDATAKAAFKAKYNVAASVILVGPYRSALNNAGDQLSLYQPGPPDLPPDADVGAVAYVLVDQVNYSNALPWPLGADGTGLSLQRRGSASFGNDALNWQAAAPTAGTRNSNDGLADIDDDGLPDDWELASGLNQAKATGEDGAFGDADGDGLNNLQEYLSGTHPRDAGSFLRVESNFGANGGAVIRFLAVAGKTYSVLYRDSIMSGPWLKLIDLPAPAASQETEIADLVASPAGTRFYRLVTPQVP